jgi:hypothetical protein
LFTTHTDAICFTMKEVLSAPDCSVYMILGRIRKIHSELTHSVSNIATGDCSWPYYRANKFLVKVAQLFASSVSFGSLT